MHQSSAVVSWLLFSAILISLTGCGGTDPEEQSPSHDESVGAVAVACGGLTIESAAEVLAIEAEDVFERADPENAPSCSFASRSDPSKVVAYSVNTLASDADAQRFLESMTDALGRISAVETVDGLGDEAFRAPWASARRLLARKGHTVVDLIEPTDPNLQQQAMAAIVAGL